MRVQTEVCPCLWTSLGDRIVGSGSEVSWWVRAAESSAVGEGGEPMTPSEREELRAALQVDGPRATIGAALVAQWKALDENERGVWNAVRSKVSVRSDSV